MRQNRQLAEADHVCPASIAWGLLRALPSSSRLHGRQWLLPLLGLGDPTRLPWSSTSPAFDHTKNRTCQFDLEKARSLVQQAGVSNVQLDLEYSTESAELGAMAQIIQADFAMIGVSLALTPTDRAQLAYRQH